MPDKELPEVQDAFKNAAMRLIKRPEFRADLDALSADVLVRIDELSEKHMVTLLECGWTSEYVDELIAMLCGWILGFESDDGATREQKLDRTMKRMIIAAVASGWSGGNCEKIYDRAKH